MDMNVVKVIDTMINRMNQGNSFLQIVKKICIAKDLNNNMIMNGLIGIHIKYNHLLTKDRQLTLKIIAILDDQGHVHSLNIKNNNIKAEEVLKTNLLCEVVTKEKVFNNISVVLNSKVRISIEVDHH